MTLYSSGLVNICCKNASAIASLITISLPVTGLVKVCHGPPSSSTARILMQQTDIPSL